MKNLFGLRQSRVRIVFRGFARHQRRFCLRDDNKSSDADRDAAVAERCSLSRPTAHYDSYNHKSFNFNIIQYFIETSSFLCDDQQSSDTPAKKHRSWERLMASGHFSSRATFESGIVICRPDQRGTISIHGTVLLTRNSLLFRNVLCGFR